MSKKMASREHVFVCTKHGIQHPYQWKQKNFKLHHVWLCAFPHEHNEIGVSMSDLWPSCICIENEDEMWDGAGPI